MQAELLTKLNLQSDRHKQLLKECKTELSVQYLKHTYTLIQILAKERNIKLNTNYDADFSKTENVMVLLNLTKLFNVNEKQIKAIILKCMECDLSLEKDYKQEFEKQLEDIEDLKAYFTK